MLACFPGIMIAFAANASPIVFTDVTTASGTIGSTSFTNELITISAVADTSNILPFGGGFSLDNSSASVTIGSLGTFTFITGTRFFVSQTSVPPTVGFSHSSLGIDLIEGPMNSAFSSWNMLTSIGPITGEGAITFAWKQAPVVTNGGTLVLDGGSGSGMVTFSAALAPVFAGTPGKANCHGTSVSALARQHGGLNAAAEALHYPSVQALQDAITRYCAAG